MTGDDIITGVNIALGTLGVDAGPLFDAHADELVTIEEIVQAVTNAPAGCTEW